MAQKVQFIVEAVDNATGVIKKVTEGVDGMGSKSKVSSLAMFEAGTMITTALGGIAKASIDTFAKFEKTMSGVNAVLNPTAQEMDKLTKKARDLGKSTTFSAQESAQSIEMLAKNGLDATQILNGAADASLNLAAATGAQLSSAADIATSAMLSFKKQVGELDQVVNSITGTTNLSKFGIEDYALALAQGGGVAATVGVNFEDFNASIAAISPLFQSGSDAGTSFKTFLLRLVPSSTAAADAMKNLGIITKEGQNTFFDASGKMKSMAEISGILKEATKNLSDEQKNQALNTIFGTDAMRAAAGIAGVGTEEFTKLSKAIESTSAADNAATRLDNLSGSFEQLSGAVDDILISLGGVLAPVVRAVAEGLTRLANQVSRLGEKFNELPQRVQDLGQIFAGITIGAVALSAAAAVLSVTLGGVGAAFIAIGTAALPWIAAGAAIAAVAYLLYQAYQTNFMGIKDIVDGVIQFLMTIPERRKNIVDTVGTLCDQIKNFFVGAWENISGTSSSFRESLKSTFQTSVDLIVTIIGGFIGVFINTMIAFYQVLTGDRAGAWETVKTTFIAVRDAITSYFEPKRNEFMAILTVGLALFKVIRETSWKGITNFFQTSWERIKEMGTNAVSSIADFFSGKGREVMNNAFTALMGGIEGIAKGVINGIISRFEGMINTMIDGINLLIAATNKVSVVKISSIPNIALGRLAHGGVAGEGFFGGGVVGGARGVDKVPAMLTAGEVVLNAAQQGNLARTIEGGNSGPAINVVISGNEFRGSGDDFAQKVGDMIMGEVKKHVAISGF